MNSRVPVSVIIPCYRCEATIGRAIRSIAAQSQLPTEVLLVEDCSDDERRTLTALMQVQAKYIGHLDVKVFSLASNGGPGEARNAAWRQATQPYIAFLDADDSWHPEKLALQYDWMRVHPEVALCGHQTQVQGYGGSKPAQGIPEARFINKYRFLFSNCLPTRSVMLKRDIPFRFLPGQRYSEDYQLWMLTLFSGLQGAVLNCPLAYSYKHEFGEGGLTSNMQSMQKGEIHGFRYLLSQGLISSPLFALAALFSRMKLWRRKLIVLLRNRTAK